MTTGLAGVVGLLWVFFWILFFVVVPGLSRNSAAAAPVSYKSNSFFASLTFFVFVSIGVWYWFLWSEELPLDMPLVTVGLALVVVGQLLMLWSRAALSRSSNWQILFMLNSKHIHTGAYRYIGHPMYTGLFVALLGSAIAAGSVTGVGLLCVTVCPLLVVRIFLEGSVS